MILNEEQIGKKLKRMAYQIWENNCEETEVELVGITGGGIVIAQALAVLLSEISPLKVHLSTLYLNKKKPLSEPIKIERSFDGKSVVLVDDVTNSGKTLLYSLQPILAMEPKRLSIAVLVDREHKSFPVVPTIIGYSIATTIQDMIFVNYEGDRLTSAHLE